MKGKIGMNKKNKRLFVAVIITSMMIIIMAISKYKTTKALKDTDTKIATPIVTFTLKELEIQLDPTHKEKTYEFEVSNYNEQTESEVSMNYNIEIETAGNLPITFELYDYDENGNQNTSNLLAINGNMTQDKKLEVGSKTKDKYILKMIWNENETNYLYSKEIDFVNVKLNSEQID